MILFSMGYFHFFEFVMNQLFNICALLKQNKAKGDQIYIEKLLLKS